MFGTQTISSLDVQVHTMHCSTYPTFVFMYYSQHIVFLYFSLTAKPDKPGKPAIPRAESVESVKTSSPPPMSLTTLLCIILMFILYTVIIIVSVYAYRRWTRGKNTFKIKTTEYYD